METVHHRELLEALRPNKQWVCYTYPDKIPYSPGNGTRAKADDPSTWGTYEQAQARLTLSPGKYAGVGYELLKEQGLTGIDLDNCRDEQGVLLPFAQDVIKRLNSYTEVTPSKRGMRVWVYGTLPENLGTNRPTHDGVEMYDHARYFTVTGDHAPDTPTTIERRQEELTALYTEVVERRLAAKQRPAPTTTKTKAAPGGDTPYCLKALEDECRQLATTGSGARNDQLNTAAFNMGRYVGGYGISRSTVERELFSACVQNGLVKEDEQAVRSTLRSGIEAGMKQSKSVPERAVEYKPSKHTVEAASNGNGNHAGNTSTAQAGGNALPTVTIAGQLRDYTAAALEALRLSEQQEHTLFVQSARLVKIGHDEKKRPIILHIGIAELRNALTRSANYYRLKEKEGNWIPVEIAPPKDLAEAILGLNPQEWPFPALEAIVETPVLRPDGTILDTPGYDAATLLYYMPSSSMSACKVPAHPTQTDIDQALALLIDAIGEFPYVSHADKANALALLMTPLVRPAIKRHIPLALIDAPKAGTGKGLLADTAALIATGNAASNLTAPDDDDEWDKRITALLMQGRSIICIDNLKGMLQSAALDSTLTSDEKEGRVLGYSKMVKVANRATWLATGNNIKLGGDLARRCYRIRLDPQVSRPWMRTGFKHDDLATWVLEHRAELIGAILTLARAWFLAGKPLDPQIPALGTFTNWARMLGGILKFVGIPDFLGNLEKLYQEADEDSAQWEIFLQAWHEHFGEAGVKISEVVKVLNAEPVAGSVAGSVFLDTLPEGLQISLKDKPQSFAIRLGKALERRVDTRFGPDNFCLKKEFDTNAKQKKWRVLAGSAGSPLTHARSESGQILLFEKEKEKEENNKYSNGESDYPHYPQAENADVPQVGSTSPVNAISVPVESENTLPAILPPLPANDDSESQKRRQKGRILAANPQQPGESKEAYARRISELQRNV
jgi:hypothetical protein